MSSAALPYHEPGIVDSLILSSFLLILNVINSVVDGYLYCGLIGQILVGIAWGAPGAAWLSPPLQETITQLGYLGLILLVFEGGLSTSFSALKSNLLLSVGVASVGIVLPMAFSFSLMGFANATPLQAFAAGAALCSTSLGTTFTLLSSSGLVRSRLGVVLSSAAMLDDVVGLVMVQVISNLGASPLSAVTVIRPILVSLAFATIWPLVCVFVVKPATHSTIWHRRRDNSKWQTITTNGFHIAFVMQALLLVAFVTGASYAGTSNLFAAYLAGATISWWYAENEASNQNHQKDLMNSAPCANSDKDARDSENLGLPLQQARINSHEKTNHMPKRDQKTSTSAKGAETYSKYFETAVRRILKPFFFASIGFSIPISKMFSGAIIWRGIIYTVLMILGKLACGLWLFPLNGLPLSSRKEQAGSEPMTTGDFLPASILGFAMVARGEIGFLISSIAESDGIFVANEDSGSGTASDLFLIVSWAIVICTIVGPICVGLVVRKIQRSMALEGLERRTNDDPWGIQVMKAI